MLTRDRHRCRAPGWAHATFVDVHHVQPHAEGGRNEAANLLTLCGAHHRAVHRGELLIEPNHEGGFSFRYADGAAYGYPVAPRLIDAHAKVFSALRHLGFHEGEVKEVLSALRCAESGQHPVTGASSRGQGQAREALACLETAEALEWVRPIEPELIPWFDL